MKSRCQLRQLVGLRRGRSLIHSASGAMSRVRTISTELFVGDFAIPSEVSLDGEAIGFKRSHAVARYGIVAIAHYGVNKEPRINVTMG